MSSACGKHPETFGGQRLTELLATTIQKYVAFLRKVRNCRNRDMMFRNVWNFLLNSDTSTLPHQNITHPISTNTHLSVMIGTR